MIRHCHTKFSVRPQLAVALASCAALVAGCGQVLEYDGRIGVDPASADGGLDALVVDAGGGDGSTDANVRDASADGPRDAYGDSIADARLETGPTVTTLMGTWVTGGSFLGSTTTIRGQFGWAPSLVVTNGTITVSGAFH